MNWLAISIALSIVLTVVLNVAVRAFPRASERIGQKLTSAAQEQPNGSVYVPWKAMIVVSLLVTISLNLILWVRR